MDKKSIVKSVYELINNSDNEEVTRASLLGEHEVKSNLLINITCIHTEVYIILYLRRERSVEYRATLPASYLSKAVRLRGVIEVLSPCINDDELLIEAIKEALRL